MVDWGERIEIVKDDFSRKILRRVYEYAWENSDDVVTKSAAVIVSSDLKQILSFGANHFPKGVVPTETQLSDRDWKYKHIIHSEPSAIFAAARIGRSLEGSIMFMPWVPCTPCANAMIDSGIGVLVGHDEMIYKTPERWIESTNYALDLLLNAGVKLKMYQGKIGNVKNLFGGEVWEP